MEGENWDGVKCTIQKDDESDIESLWSIRDNSLILPDESLRDGVLFYSAT